MHFITKKARKWKLYYTQLGSSNTVHRMDLLENNELDSSFSNKMVNQFYLNSLNSVESLQGKPRITESSIWLTVTISSFQVCSWFPFSSKNNT